MKVWLAPSAFYPAIGGVESVTARLANELQARGHEVLVLTNKWPSSASWTERVDGVPVHRLRFVDIGRRPDRWPAYVEASVAVRRTLNALERPDVVHVHCVAGQAVPLAAYCERLHVPLVLTTHGETAMDERQVFQRSALRRHALRRSASSARHLTAVSAWTKAHATSMARTFSRAHVIGNGVDVHAWTGLPVVEAPVYAAYGRHVPQKGFDVLLRAFDTLRQHLPSARLLLGGHGAQTERLSAIAGPGVELVGSLDPAGVRALLGRARIVVVPSLVEPFGLVALEAMAAGRRIVYTNTGGLQEICRSRGFAAEPGDAQGLAAALHAAHSSPDGRTPDTHDLAAEYSWPRITDSYERLYSE